MHDDEHHAFINRMPFLSGKVYMKIPEKTIEMTHCLSALIRELLLSNAYCTIWVENTTGFGYTRLVHTFMNCFSKIYWRTGVG